MMLLLAWYQAPGGQQYDALVKSEHFAYIYLHTYMQRHMTGPQSREVEHATRGG